MSKMTRRSFLKKFTFGTLSTIGLAYGGYYYAREIEPKWLNIIEKEIESHRIPESFNDFKILQFSDVHFGFHYDREQLIKLINQIEKMNFDLIVFTGDLTDDPSLIAEKQFEEITEELFRLHADYGKYWIYGNHDHGGYGTQTIKQVMENSGFRLLKNETVLVEKDNDMISLSGLDDVMLGRPDLNALIDESYEHLFNILLCHEPDFADRTKQYPYDVQLSGHSHGGQIQLPFIGPIVTPALGEKYVEGHYELGSRPLNLFVSRGIGTTRLPFRFLCRPEINLFTLKHLS